MSWRDGLIRASQTFSKSLMVFQLSVSALYLFKLGPSNREFWIAKIERNRQRDREVNAYYRSKGWTVLRFWDFEVKN